MEDTQRKITATRGWLKKWGKKEAPPESVQKIVDSLAQNIDQTYAALQDIGVYIKEGKKREFERVILPQLQSLINCLQNENASYIQDVMQIQNSHTKPKKPESVSGPGFPLQDVIVDPNVRAQPSEIDSMMEHLDLDNVYNTCRELTNFEPQRLQLSVRFQSLGETGSQGSIETGNNYELEYHPEKERAFLKMMSLDTPKALTVNYDFAKKNPGEMRGVLYHEFGHLWTQRLVASGNYAYFEGVAEIMRILAAQKENADWEQASGENYQLLYGKKLPKMVSNNQARLGGNLGFVAKSLIAYKFLNLLGGSKRENLYGIAKACSFHENDRSFVPYETILLDIERETNVPGFAHSFLNDPLLKPGTLQTGPLAIAIPTIQGNACVIVCIDVLETGDDYNWTREKCPVIPRKSFALEDFRTEPISTRFHSFDLLLRHSHSRRSIELNGSGSLTLSPQFILNFAKAGGWNMPAGEISIQFRMAGQHKPEQLHNVITITNEDIQRSQIESPN